MVTVEAHGRPRQPLWNVQIPGCRAGIRTPTKGSKDIVWIQKPRLPRSIRPGKAPWRRHRRVLLSPRFWGNHGTMSNPPPRPSLAPRITFATTGTPSGVAFAIMDARSGDLVGCCGIDDWSKADVAQFGYWIAASARGRGYATRAVILLTRWLFELGAARVLLTIVAENEESVAVARRAGFVYEGTMRSHGVWQGRRCDVMWFAALPLEWTMRGPDEQT